MRTLKRRIEELERRQSKRDRELEAKRQFEHTWGEGARQVGNLILLFETPETGTEAHHNGQPPSTVVDAPSNGHGPRKVVEAPHKGQGPIRPLPGKQEPEVYDDDDVYH